MSDQHSTEAQQVIQRMMEYAKLATENELCRILGVSQSALAMAKKRGRLSERLLFRYATKYNVPVSFLLGKEPSVFGAKTGIIEVPLPSGQIQVFQFAPIEVQLERVKKIYEVGSWPMQKMLDLFLSDFMVALTAFDLQTRYKRRRGRLKEEDSAELARILLEYLPKAQEMIGSSKTVRGQKIRRHGRSASEKKS